MVEMNFPTNTGLRRDGLVTEVDYKYSYPNDLKLKPGSSTHEKLKNLVLERARASSITMSRRYSAWNKIDQKLTAYIPLDEYEKKVKNDDSRSPVSIVIPMTFATMETILTYLTSTFLQDTIFRYIGTGPEDTVGVKLGEKLIELQSHRFKHPVSLHTHWRDSICYGFGVITPVWEVRETTRVVQKPLQIFSALYGTNIVTDQLVEQEETVLLAEGNNLINISPYAYLPDTNVPIHDVQKGEYVGWIDRDNLMNLLGREYYGEFFNVQYLYHCNQKHSSIHNQHYANINRDDRGGSYHTIGTRPDGSDGTNPVDVVYMYINLVPKDFDLGDREYPEKWFFALAGDEVLIAAQPMNINHGMFPVAVAAPDFDGYGSDPVSKLEIAYGMQETIDWLFASHITNVRKAINDMLIVDPSLVNMQDLSDPKPGMLIRLRSSAWGRGAKDAVAQLQVNDITRNNIQDTVYLADMLQRTTGATDSLQGILRQSSERKSATEVRDTRSSALSRLNRMAMMISMQSHYDIAMQLMFNTQQFMSETAYVDSIGRWGEDLALDYGLPMVGGKIPIDPRQLNVAFDVAPLDSSLNSGEYASDWIELYRIITASPELTMAFDTVKVFKHIARLMGATNTRDFERRPVQPILADDSQVAAGVEAGNLIPLEGIGA